MVRGDFDPFPDVAQSLYDLVYRRGDLFDLQIGATVSGADQSGPVPIDGEAETGHQHFRAYLDFPSGKGMEYSGSAQNLDLVAKLICKDIRCDGLVGHDSGGTGGIPREGTAFGLWGPDVCRRGAL